MTLKSEKMECARSKNIKMILDKFVWVKLVKYLFAMQTL